MQVHLDCYPCFLRQAAMTLSRVEADRDAKFGCISSVAGELTGIDPSRTPAHATTFMYRKIRESLGVDPYIEVKRQYNDIALSLLPNLRERVKKSADPLWSAVRIAIAGNIIDFGIYKDFDMDAAIERSLGKDITIDHYDAFRSEAGRYDKILYLCDNAGELAFDRLLIEELIEMGKDVTAVVKGAPVINDATMDDARQCGIDSLCRTIDNGSDCVGTILEWCSDSFVGEFLNHPLIISKGQGNYETLYTNPQNIFFLFQAKCDVVAAMLSVPHGAMILTKSPLI